MNIVSYQLLCVLLLVYFAQDTRYSTVRLYVPLGEQYDILYSDPIQLVSKLISCILALFIDFFGGNVQYVWKRCVQAPHIT